MTESSRNLRKNQDRISKLPDEILISIISRLTLREATATSVLSTCWRYLHTYITHLNFPERRHSIDPAINRANRLDHIDMVNRVLDSHRGCHIKEFKVKYDRKQIFKKCFEFALTKKAEIIHTVIRFGEFHTLSRTLLLHGLKFLKELSLSCIDMTEEEFVFLLSNSLALESLSITHPDQKKLKNISIVGHSKLKHFGLSYAWLAESIEIRDVINLVSLKLFELSSECTVQLSNIPKLIKLDYKERFYHLPYAEFSARMPSCIRDQLQLLHLSTCSNFCYQASRPLLVNMSVKLVNTKHLELVIDMEDKPGCFFVRNIFFLIEACPSLQKLIIKFSWKLSCMEFKKIELDKFVWMGKKLTPKYLKEMEIIGYLGSLPDFKLTSHIVNSAKALEKLIVVPCDLNDAVREESSARARRDFQHIRRIRSVNVIVLGEKSRSRLVS